MKSGENRLWDAYLWHRQHPNAWATRPMSATNALKAAREDVATNKLRYPNYIGYKHGGNWQRIEDMDKWAHSYGRAYYCDNWPAGWRVCGTAQDVCRSEGSRRVDHAGWYTDGFQDGALQGYVLQISSRKGIPQYVPGTKHSDWDGVTIWPMDRYETLVECATAADHYAEKAAEKEREYQEAWQAGQQAKEFNDEADSARKDILQLCKDIRDARPRVIPDLFRDTIDVDLLCRLLAPMKEKITRLWDELHEARDKRDELRSNYGNTDAFKEAYLNG